MSDHEEIDRVLRDLPRVDVSEDFTRRVMWRVRAQSHTSAAPLPARRGRVLLVAAACLLAVGSRWLTVVDEPANLLVVDAPAPLSVAEVSALRMEIEAMRAELESLQRQPRRQVFALPGDDGRDVLMDFRPASLSRSGRSQHSMIQPARFERVMGVGR